jgi:di-heme oxidoreductase (putative peroxidase)
MEGEKFMEPHWTLKYLVSGLAIGLLGGCYHHQSSQPLADQQNLIQAVRISQDEINAGSVPFEKLFYAGKHIFSNRFTTDDHYGEGEDGPRRTKYSLTDRPNYPFLRFNGLDSQSCLECHSVIGFSSQDYSQEEEQVRFIKQPGITGGGAGFASNAFGLENFACTGGEDCDPTKGFIRSPPHAFGAGYTQQLAEEMTWDLQEILQEAALTPGVSKTLESKGVSFGDVVADANGTVDVAASNLVGVSEDLVVRPFQWKGLASNLRNFITGAMNFHFSVQPKELFDSGALDSNTDDKDAEVNEILEGEITAVGAFLAMLRPPVESSKGLDEQKVEKGKAVFIQSDCATCHMPTLEMESPYVSVRDPRKDQDIQVGMKDKFSYALSASRKPKQTQTTLTVPYGEVAPAVEKYAVKKALKERIRQQGKVTDPAGFQAMLVQEFSDKLAGFTHSLNDSSGPPETLPRLPQNDQGTVDVPLYSDLKRHKMGPNLAESFPQNTDAGETVQVPKYQYLTRPLWGVADTGPWMHDGRALKLSEAILMHEGTDSEANTSIGKYKSLSDQDKEALRTFLSSLRLPKFKPCHWWCG